MPQQIHPWIFNFNGIKLFLLKLQFASMKDDVTCITMDIKINVA